MLPRWSGERLDLIVDFLTYTAVPAFALSQADLLPEAYRLPAGIAVMLSSLFHMADQDSKTKEGYFVGFPAIWNVVCLYLFAFMPQPYVSLAVVAFLVVLTFVPILCVHPFRVTGLRGFSVAITALWVVAAIGAVANPFPSPLWVKAALAHNRGLSRRRRRGSLAAQQEGIVSFGPELGSPLDLHAISPDLGAGRLIPPN